LFATVEKLSSVSLLFLFQCTGRL